MYCSTDCKDIAKERGCAEPEHIATGSFTDACKNSNHKDHERKLLDMLAKGANDETTTSIDTMPAEDTPAQAESFKTLFQANGVAFQGDSPSLPSSVSELEHEAKKFMGVGSSSLGRGSRRKRSLSVALALLNVETGAEREFPSLDSLRETMKPGSRGEFKRALEGLRGVAFAIPKALEIFNDGVALHRHRIRFINDVD